MNTFKGITQGLMVALLFSVFAAPVSAASVTGSISLSADFVPTGGTGGLSDATGIDFLGDNFDVDGVTGDFASKPIIQGDLGVAKDFTFSPSAAVGDLFTIAGFDFDLTALSIDFQSSDFLVLSGTGILGGNGFDPTAATMMLTANTAGPLFNLSATISTNLNPIDPVPLPAAAWLFISALGGLVVSKRRQQKT